MGKNFKNKKLNKIIQGLQNSGVTLSEQPTNILFVSNSSVLMGVSIECLEELFTEFDPNCSFIVYPNSKSYSFVQFSDIERAKNAKSKLDGKTPNNFPKENPPISLLFVEKVPDDASSKVVKDHFPNGLRLLPEFISKDLESELIEFIERRLPETSKLKNRRVLHFGYKFNYDSNVAIEPADESIPEIFDGLIDKIMGSTRIQSNDRPNQITVNIYEQGQGIPPHTDTHSTFAEPIFSLSLCSDVVMEFRYIASAAKHGDVFMARRSLMIMMGEARYRFKHGIMSRKYDLNPENNRLIKRQRRMSITFRKSSNQPCHCPFIEFCDWDRAGKMRIPNSDEQGKCLEREYVGKVYERIADHFDLTRQSNWTGVSAFLNSLAPNSLLMDIGCGNGKYLLRSDKLIKFGCDLSENLLKKASTKGCTVLRADALELPLRNACFDAAISIAVIHHFSTRERRRKAIEQILTILRPGGLACVTAWAFEQKTPDAGIESIYAAKMRANKSIEHSQQSISALNDNGSAAGGRLRVHDGRHFTQQDMLVPWSSSSHSNAVNDFRYYHLFMRGELAELVQNEFGDRVELIKEEYDEGNWVVVFRRK